MQKIKEFINDKTTYVFWMVVLVQVVCILIAGALKSNFHQDELYTFGSAHYMADSTSSDRYMYQSEMFSEKTWLNIGEFKELLYVDDYSSLFTDSITSIGQKLMVKNPYECLLNFTESIFTPGYVSKWTGIAINIVMFVIMQFVMYLLVSDLTDKKTGLLAVLFWGFSGVAISIFVYVRFYSFTHTMLMLSVYFHNKMWKSNHFVKTVFYELVAYGCLFEAFLCSQLVTVIIAALYLAYGIGVLIKRKWLNFIIHIIPVVLGITVFFAPFISYFKNVLKKPESYITTGGPAFLIINNFKTLTVRELVKRIYKFALYLGDNLYGSIIILMIICIFAVVLFIIRGRSESKTKKFSNDGFIFVIVAVAAVYSLFAIIVALWLPRYHGLIYPMIAVISVVLFRYLTDGLPKKYGYICGALLGLAVITAPMLGHVDNVFYNERQMVDYLRNSEIKDNVIWNLEDFQIIHECVYLRSSDCRMYVCSEFEELKIKKVKSGDFLLWISEGITLTDEQINNFAENGFEVAEDLGIIQDAHIYHIRRME